MKKFVSLLLVLVMVFGLAVSAAAAEDKTFDSRNGQTPGTAPDGTSDWQATGDVQLIVSEGNDGGKVYYVTVEWKSLDFTYQKYGVGDWNPEEHEYEDEDTAGWVAIPDDVVSGENNSTIRRPAAIVVTNHSNAPVLVNALFDNYRADKTGTTNTNVTATLDLYGLQTIPTAEETTFASAPNVAYGLVVSGTPTANEAVFGTITVTITAG